MIAVKAVFDGERVILPRSVSGVAPGKVIVVFEDQNPEAEEETDWMRLQEEAFLGAWDNDEDSIYDSL